jgi:hypothetical protein
MGLPAELRSLGGTPNYGPRQYCLFRLLAASSHQKLLRTAKRSAFQPASIKFVGAKTIQNQHKYIIGWVVVIVGIRHFLNPEPYEQLYLPPHVIVMILRFSPQPDSPRSQIFRKVGQKNLNQTGSSHYYRWQWVNTHRVLLPHTHTHDIKITPSGHLYTLTDMDLLPYPCGYGSPIGSSVPTKAKHLSKYYMIQMSSISI